MCGISIASLALNPKPKIFCLTRPIEHRGERNSQMPGAGTATHNGKSEPRFLTTSYFDDSNYAAVILAGGDGVRLSSFTREVFGYHLPKQFCPLFEGKTLLEQTMRRVSMLVPPAQTLTVLNRAHREVLLPAAQRNCGQQSVHPARQSWDGARDPVRVASPAETGHTGPGGDLSFRSLRQRRFRLHAPCRHCAPRGRIAHRS